MAEFADQPATTAGGVGCRISDTDWMCTDVACGNINFARRTTCNRCNKERADLKFMSKKKQTTEIGKSAADKSRGLFSADDWQCNKCANVNWARRQTCNVCNAPKFGEVEARTGYGGGYNERGTVEYRPRRDSDEDEYDEFGRRKKRKGRDRDPVAHSSDKVGAPPDVGRKRSLSESSNLPAPTAAHRTLKWIRGLAEERISRPELDLGDDAGPVYRPVAPLRANPDGRLDTMPTLRPNAKIHSLDDVVPVATVILRPDARLIGPACARTSTNQSTRIVDPVLHQSGGGVMHRGIAREYNCNLGRNALPDIRPTARSHPRYTSGRFNGTYVKHKARTLSRAESLETVGGECSRVVTDGRDRPLSGDRSADSKKILSGRDSVDSSAPLLPAERCPLPATARNREHPRYRNPSFERGQYISLEKNSRRCEATRDSVMENQVSSTNEIKYHFKGRTVDESFEVTYSLEERVWAAACAIAHRSCKAAAEMFQSTYDKPAPDFKMVFAWRQRLLTTGCLLDSHIPKDVPRLQVDPPEKIGKRWRLRKKRFYMHPKESSDTSEDDLANFQRKPQPRRNKYSQEEIIILNSPDSDGVDKNKDPTGKEKSAGLKENADAVSAYRSSSSQTTRINLNEKRKSTDCPLTDGTRSITPELMTTRMDLARFGSPPVKPASPPMTFHDDIYFEGDAPQKDCEKNQEPDNPAQFAVPDIPKLTMKAVRSMNALNDCINKSYLEDIMSESELHSSDGVQSDNDSCDRVVSERNPNSDNKSAASVSPVPPTSNDIYDDGPTEIFLKSNTVEVVRDDDCNRYSPSKVTQLNTGIANTESDNIKYDEQQNGCAKNFSSAMRRIYERMSTEEKEKGGEIESALEYVPTKIDPAMAKRNHRMFKSDSIMIESIHDIWPDNSSSKGSIGKEISSNDSTAREETAGKENPVKSNHTASLFADYLPDEDALYRDASNEGFSDSLKTPPVAPIIGSISQYNSALDDEQREPVAHNPDDNVKSIVADSLNTLVNFNFATVNADQLALALKNIQDMLISKEILDKTINEVEQNKQIINVDDNVAKESQPADVNKTVSPDSDNKNANIPFLDDMFYPGSPVVHGSQEAREVCGARALKSVDFNPDVNLDDMLECPMQAKKPILISGFQSFAIPKPIMLNRLKSLTRLKEASNAAVDNDNSKMKTDVKIKRKRKRVKSNDADKNESVREDDEDEEESGDDEDLSKYDLCGSEEENDDHQKKTDAGGNAESSSLNNKSAPEKNDNQRREKSRSPVRNQGGDQPRKRSPDDSGSSSSRRSSSSSSSSSASSSGRPPKNRYDDFNLNSEHSRAGSREDSPNNRSRSPIYPSAVDNNRSRNSNDKRRSSRSRSRDNKTKSRITNQDSVTRDKGRSRESNRDRDNRDRIKSGRDSRDARRPHHSQNHTQNQRYHHHPRGRGRGGNQTRRMW